MEFYFVRHGQSTNNLLYEILTANSRTNLYEAARVADPPLTPEGKAQARNLAKLLNNKHASKTKVLTSPMFRALQTAQPIASALGTNVEVWLDLHEHGGMYYLDEEGKYVGLGGLNKDQIQHYFPGTVITENFNGPSGGWFTSPTTESTSQTLHRADLLVKKLIEFAHSPVNKHIKYLWIITHGTFLSMILPRVLKLTSSSNIVIHHNNVGVSGLVVHPDGTVSIKFLNRIIEDVSNLKEETNYELPPVLDIDHPSDCMLYGVNIKPKL